MQRSSSPQRLVNSTIAAASEAAPLAATARFGAWGHDEREHPNGQFIYAAAGSCTVTAVGSAYPVDETRAVWIPPRIPHSARFGSAFSRFLRFTGTVGLRTAPVVVVVRAEFRRALLASVWEDNGIDALVATEIARATGTAPDGGLAVIEPIGPLTAPIAAALRRNPADDRTLDAWARELHSSSVSIRRAFRQETGLSYSAWRTRVRLNASLDGLRLGRPISTVAHEVGFSHNGLLAAFHRHLDCAPSSLCLRARQRPDAASARRPPRI